jgi:hypothetical protein
MKRLFLFIVLGFIAVSASAEPCYIQLANGTCAQRYWQDLDTFILESYPSHTAYNPSSGVYEVFTCHMLPGNVPKSPECWIGGTLILPEPITLRAWCGILKNASLQAFTSFYDLGICPLNV